MGSGFSCNNQESPQVATKQSSSDFGTKTGSSLSRSGGPLEATDRTQRSSVTSKNTISTTSSSFSSRENSGGDLCLARDKSSASLAEGNAGVEDILSPLSPTKNAPPPQNQHVVPPSCLRRNVQESDVQERQEVETLAFDDPRHASLAQGLPPLQSEDVMSVTSDNAADTLSPMSPVATSNAKGSQKSSSTDRSTAAGSGFNSLNRMIKDTQHQDSNCSGNSSVQSSQSDLSAFYLGHARQPM